MKIAVGEISLEWAMVDDVVTQTLTSIWHYAHAQTERIPRSFDRRVTELKRLTKLLYQNEPDEFRIYSWFDQRIRTANGKRDDICHGLPGRITKNGREYEGLSIPFPSQLPRHVPFNLDDTESLVRELQELHTEAAEVHRAIGAALFSSSQGTLIGPAPYGLKPVTPGNRNPMLPQAKPPPATFQA